MIKNKTWFKVAASVVATVIITSTASAQDAPETKGPANPYWNDPITNPVYLDTATIKPQFDVVYMHQSLPSQIETAGGNNAQLDGDMNVVSLQLEYPITERMAIVADKTGYIDLNPGGIGQKQEGYADIAAGIKYAFWPLDMERLSCAARATVEIPFGDEQVLQDNGEGNISPALLATYQNQKGLICDRPMAINSVLGGIIPFNNNEESTMAYAGVSVAQQVTPWLTGMLEMNYFHVIEDGHGKADFSSQPPVELSTFEGGDLINLGADNAETHRHFLTTAIGGRYQVTDGLSLGVAYEIPLTHNEHGLMEDRVTANVSYNF